MFFKNSHSFYIIIDNEILSKNTFIRGFEMKTAWFIEKSHRLDMDLRQQLQQVRAIHTQSELTLPVLVKLTKETEGEQRAEVFKACENEAKAEWCGEFSYFHGFHGNLSPAAIRILAEDERVERLYLDKRVTAYLDIASKATGVRAVQVEEGLTGKGVTIAVVDTGVHPHEDLTQPTNRIVAFKDFVNEKKTPYDDQGHGTHCVGDAAGNGTASQGLYTGPAMEANVVGVKVLDAEGGGQLSTVMKGIEWCIKNREKYSIRVISLSLGAIATESYRDDPLCQVVEKAWHRGIVVCAAAGNEGPAAGTISTPGHDPIILTVGTLI